MAACTFFGHRECPVTIKPILENTLEYLIVYRGVDRFYVGNQGQFDAYVRGALRELIKHHPHVRYAVVLAYLPGRVKGQEDHSDTMVPDGIEEVHPRYAISWRNNWMLCQADFVVTYITHTWGSAFQFAERAKRQGKEMINIA